MERRHEWMNPGAFQVAPGVYRIPLPLPEDGLRAVNVYALEDPDGLVLIDGGWALEESRRQLETSLKDLGFRLADITRFLVTHVHRDHYTQAVAVRREFGTRVSLGIGERHTLETLTRPGPADRPAARAAARLRRRAPRGAPAGDLDRGRPRRGRVGDAGRLDRRPHAGDARGP
jgi:glyoxylase-like metal-dependent hydrolase (beta-lactamase superfamily II)